MALATVEELKRTISGGSGINDNTAQQALDDAIFFLADYEIIDTTLERFSLYQRLYAAHLLHVQGKGQKVSSKNVGDVSVSYESRTASDKDESSPYLEQFRKLISNNDFLVSI